MKKLPHLITTLALCALLAACGTDSSSGSSSSGDSGAGLATEGPATPGVSIEGASGERPAFSLRLTDAPVDGVVAVVMQFTRVQIRNINGSLTNYTFETPQSFDLLALQGSKTADLLVNMPLDNGEYDQIILFVDEAPMATYVDLGPGGVSNLKVKDGSTKGLKIKGNFSVTDSRNASFVLDFDLRKSIKLKKKTGEYEFKAKLRLVERAGSGHIRGSVPVSMLTGAAGCSDNNVDTFNAVYIYEGHNAKVDDIDQSKKKPKGPLSTTIINYDSDSQSYIYEAAFLPSGDYTIAYTCNSNLEDLDSGKDKLRFFGIRNATVVVNNIAFL